MENGASKVEEVKSQVEEFDKDVLEDGPNAMKTDDAFKEANGVVENALATVKVEEPLVVRKDGSGENDEGLGVYVEVDGSVNASQGAVEKCEDVFETPCETQTDMEKAHVDADSVEVILTKVIDEESSSGNAAGDQLAVIESDEIVDCDEHEGKTPNLAEVAEERNMPDSTATLSGQPSGLEANGAVNDSDVNSEAKMVNLMRLMEKVLPIILQGIMLVTWKLTC